MEMTRTMPMTTFSVTMGEAGLKQFRTGERDVQIAAHDAEAEAAHLRAPLIHLARHPHECAPR